MLDGPATCVRDVLLGPLCLVAEQIKEGVGAPRSLAVEVLRRLRESQWLEVPAASEVLEKISGDPELLWDEAWLEVKSRGDLGMEAALPRIAAWLAARSEQAREICQKQLTPAEKSSPYLRPRWSPELAALGLARAGDQSLPVLRALAGWHHLDGREQHFSAKQGDGRVSMLTTAALKEAQLRPETTASWTRSLRVP